MANEERINWMRERLTNALQPSLLLITDDSHKHIGHVGAKSGAGHFSIKINSSHFNNLPLLACHRIIYTVLGEAIPSQIHALRIKIVRH
jgi:BolA protein